MAMAGAKPKEDRSQIRHRVPPVHDWTEVPNVPFDGPQLPARDIDETADGRPMGQLRQGWPRRTKQWWEALRKMPHAKLWTENDWEYAFDVAEVHARFVEGWKGANGAELRMREKLLGNTMDSRRDMRIRYVAPPDPEAEAAAAHLAGVTRLDDFRTL